METATATDCSALPQVPAVKRLNVLVIDEQFPWPLDSGKRIRTWNLLRRLAKHHDITFLCHGRPTDDERRVAMEAGIHAIYADVSLEHSGISLYARLAANLVSSLPYSVAKHRTRCFARTLRTTIAQRHFDLVHCEWTPYASYLSLCRDIPSIVATHNVECQIWQRRAECSRSAAARFFFALQAARMESFERGELPKARMVTAVSALDRQKFEAWGVPHSAVIDNGVDPDYFQLSPAAPVPGRMVFVGSLDWFPNRDAIIDFVENTLPIIRTSVPSCSLQVIGRKADADLARHLASAGVHLVSSAPDVRPHLANAEVVVVPLRIGGGTRIKILEALSMGKAVVSTTVGAEGLSVVPGEHIAIADKPADFAHAVIELMRDPSARIRMGSVGRQLVIQRYSWDNLADRLNQLWKQAAEPGCGLLYTDMGAL